MKLRASLSQSSLTSPMLWIIVLMGLFIFSRLLCLLTAIEACSYLEELSRGNVGKTLLEGLQKPLWEYQVDHYSGGSLLVSVLAAFFFKLFGLNLFALKLVSLFCFSLPAGLIMYHYLKKIFPLRVAILSVLIFIFPGPGMTQMSLLAMGYHSESILFSIGIFYFYCAWTMSQKQNNLNLIVFGFLGGFGMWFTPIVGLSVAACILSDLFDDGAMFKGKNLIICFFSFLFGFMPCVIYNINYRFDGAHFILNGFATKARYHDGIVSFVEYFGKRVVDLAVSQWPQSYGFQRRLGLVGGAASTLYFFLSIISWVGLTFELKNKQNKLFMPILIYPIIFLTVYGVSTFSVGSQEFLAESRYFIPLHFCMIMIIAVFGAQKGGIRKIVYGILLLLGCVGYSTLIFKSNFGRALQYKGYYLSMMDIANFKKKTPDFLPELQKALLNPADRIENHSIQMRCYSLFLVGSKAGNHSLETVKNSLKDISEQDQVCFYSGLAMSFSEWPFTSDRFHNINEQSREFFYRRVASYLALPEDDPRRKWVELNRHSFSKQESKWFYRGLGQWVTVANFSQDLRGLEPLLSFLNIQIPREN